MRLRRLQARLLVWFLAAILLAVGASVLTTFLTSSDPGETPTRVVSRHVQHRLARLWDDPVATEAYVAELRDTTGLDMRVRRDPALFSGRRGRGQNGMIFEDGVAYVPVVKGGVVVGALELRTGSPAPQLWRVAVALAAALLVLGLVARRVSKRLARPLEHLAQTAERFGSGDLAARTGIEKLPRRWVAEEVRDVGQAFDTMADRIARVVLEQRELLAAISHELRSPLGRARVALEIARDRKDALDDVDRQLVEIDAILGDLLASARAGLADLRIEEVDLVPWLRKRIAAESTGGGQPGPIELGVDDGAASARVKIDPALLGRAIHNLLANAWAHGHPKDQPLDVAVSNGEGRVRVAVRDRGPGFADAVLPRAFEPFVMGGDAARSPGRPRGMGLGLTLVRRIVEAHGGSVSAANLDGAGAEVAIELPVA
ncbi:MAG: HAMP domain-containing histidine kinase [Labilithrix sp.]|nr:HAMP domain-containing histidine kinase [Labilithrix sp.]